MDLVIIASTAGSGDQMGPEHSGFRKQPCLCSSTVSCDPEVHTTPNEAVFLRHLGLHTTDQLGCIFWEI